MYVNELRHFKTYGNINLNHCECSHIPPPYATSYEVKPL
jgi:hypothetical protein